MAMARHGGSFIWLAIVAGVSLGLFLNQPSKVSSEELPPPPYTEIRYSTTELTNQDVVAELISDAEITVANNRGKRSYTFIENGEFTFIFRDEYGRVLRATAEVDYIDKEPPTAMLDNLPPVRSDGGRTEILVHGEDVVAYRYRLFGQEWSESQPIATPLRLQGLPLGIQTINVIGRDQAGNWQSEDRATSYSWEVVELTAEERLLLRPRITPLAEGEKAIEVSVAEQYMWVYEGEKLVMHTPVTTGKTGMNTTAGSFQITQMHRNKWFEGGYVSKYWMRFNGGMGIHDANWRNDFGSQNYPSNGSKGCVNVPVDFAPQLYNWAEIGTKVVVI